MTMMSMVRSFTKMRAGAPLACLVAGVGWPATSTSASAAPTHPGYAARLSEYTGTSARLGLHPDARAPGSSLRPGGR